MENKKTIFLIILLIIMVALIIGTAILINKEMYNNNITDKKPNAQTSANEVLSEKPTVTQKSDEEIVRDLFLESLKNNNAANEEKLLDYKIDKINIFYGEEKQKLIDSRKNDETKGEFREDDILATVEYSVKPKDVNNTVWVVGKAEINGEWINKVDFAMVRDGKISRDIPWSGILKSEEEKNTVTQNKEDLDKGLVEELFLESLKNANDASEEKLLDYKVDSINILSKEEKQKEIQDFGREDEGFVEEDIFAKITYSVKPKNINNTSWIAGNGEINGKWIVKTASVVVHDGNITVGTGDWSLGKTDEEIVEELFLEYIEENDKQGEERLIDYKIDKITVLSEAEKQEVINTHTDEEKKNKLKNDDVIFANVYYSVKARDINKTVFNAGNGIQKGEWFSKSACTIVCDGVLSSGTGW